MKTLICYEPVFLYVEKYKCQRGNKSVLHPLRERKAGAQVMQEGLASLEREESRCSSSARASYIP